MRMPRDGAETGGDLQPLHHKAECVPHPWRPVHNVAPMLFSRVACHSDICSNVIVSGAVSPQISRIRNHAGHQIFVRAVRARLDHSAVHCGQIAFDCTQTTNTTFSACCVLSTTARAAKRLSVQAGRCRCSRDPAAHLIVSPHHGGLGLDSRRFNSAIFLAEPPRARVGFGVHTRCCSKCAKRKIHFATQHSPLERTFFLTSLSASRLGDLTAAFLYRRRQRSTDDDASIRGPE